MENDEAPDWAADGIARGAREDLDPRPVRLLRALLSTPKTGEDWLLRIERIRALLREESSTARPKEKP